MAGHINVCVIGTGRAGMIHARNYGVGISGARLVGLCDPSTVNLEAAQAELHVPKTYMDYHDVLADPEIDAVVIVTPTAFHHDITIAAAQAGKHVFCEKPLASTEEECDEMIAACKECGVKLQVGFMRRFDRNFRRAKEVVDSGQIGAMTLIKSHSYGPSKPQPWMYDIYKNLGPIGEVASHDFDTVRWFVGSEVKTIYAVGHNYRSPEVAKDYPDYYDTALVMLEFENGVLGLVDTAQYVRYGYDARAEVLGTTGSVRVGTQHDDTVEVALDGMRLEAASTPSWRVLFREAYVAEDSAFIRCILDDTEPEVTGYDGKMALIVVREGLRSLLEHRPITIGE